MDDKMVIQERGGLFLIEHWWKKPGYERKGWFKELLEVTPSGASRAEAEERAAYHWRLKTWEHWAEYVATFRWQR